VKAVGAAAFNEALEMIGGTAQPFGAALDRRVAMLERIVRPLDPKEAVPTLYEGGTIFQITPSEAWTVLRTREARSRRPIGCDCRRRSRR
jgi:hypothetical protein